MKSLAAILSCWLAVTFAFGDLGPNLVPNSGFEEVGEAQSPVEWSISTQHRTAVVLDDRVVHTDQYSARMEQAVPSSYQSSTFLGSALIPVEPGARYQLRWWIKSEGLHPEWMTQDSGGRGVGCFFLIDMFQFQTDPETGNPVYCYNWRRIFGRDFAEWTRVDESVTDMYSKQVDPWQCPADIDQVQLRLQVSNTMPRHMFKVWVDEVSFQKMSE